MAGRSDNCKPLKVDSTDNGVLRLALVDEFHITSAPSPTQIGSKRTFDRVHQSEETATKVTLRFCRTLPHIVGSTRVRTLYLSKLDFAVYEDPTIFHELVLSFERVQRLKVQSCNLRSSHVDDYFLHACRARGITEIDVVDASQTESLISPNGIVEFVESNKSALHDSSRDKRRIEVCFSGNPMAAVQRTIQACEQGRLAERFFVYLAHS
ncbi:hypothetical protein AAVH_29281 [Aphelenchoides avenae]|nr:hypothetical protein AAVH_29281 [Aphelenchus avenae]